MMLKPKRPPLPPNPPPKSKNQPAVAENLKAFLTTKALDESKVVFLLPHLTRSTRNEDMTVVLDKETGKILALAPVVT
jgi:hypothetical protein